jgi:hypothetical protein
MLAFVAFIECKKPGERSKGFLHRSKDPMGRPQSFGFVEGKMLLGYVEGKKPSWLQ